jgi:hypothetical protein
MKISKEQAKDFEEAHVEGMHEDCPREGCPLCESMTYQETKPGESLLDFWLRTGDTSRGG